MFPMTGFLKPAAVALVLAAIAFGVVPAAPMTAFRSVST